MPPLLCGKNSHRIHLERSPCRNQTSHQRHASEEQAYKHEGSSICRCNFEEHLLNDNDYPDASSHAVIHQFYVKKVENFLKMSFDDGHDFRAEVLSFLKEWWTYHILEEDMKYRPFLQEKGLT